MPRVVSGNETNINKEKTAKSPLVENGDIPDHEGELDLDEEEQHAEEGGVDLHQNRVVVGGGLY